MTPSLGWPPARATRDSRRVVPPCRPHATESRNNVTTLAYDAVSDPFDSDDFDAITNQASELTPASRLRVKAYKPVTPVGDTEPTFESLGLPAPLVAALARGKLIAPFAIQTAAIPD